MVKFFDRKAEELLASAKAKKRSLLADKITGDNIYKALIFFDKLYAQMNEVEKREFLSQLVDNVQIYEERKENGQWMKSIEFKLPIIEKEFTLSLDNDAQNETVYLLSFSIEKCSTHQKRFQLRTELKPFFNSNKKCPEPESNQ